MLAEDYNHKDRSQTACRAKIRPSSEVDEEESQESDRTCIQGSDCKAQENEDQKSVELLCKEGEACGIENIYD